MHYYSFNNYLREKFGEKVQRISLNAGFSCPNIDPATGKGGCVYCNELGFSRFAETSKTLEKQIESSIQVLKKKNINKFIAYFQNATNTNALPEKLKKAYDVVMAYPEIVGLFISTRPDCVDEEKLDLIASYCNDYDVWIEYGVQTIHDRTLKVINRGHLFSDSVRAIEMTRKMGIKTAAHVILGLPGETKEMMIETARELTALRVDGIKLHILHVLRDTELEKNYRNNEVELLSKEAYVESVCDFIEVLSPECVMLRLVSDASPDILVAPEWINDKLSVINAINDKFEKRGTHQGSCYRGSGFGVRK